MDLILLGGYSSHNKEWIEKVADSARDIFDNTEIIYYEHWKTGREMNLEFESAKLKESANKKECCIFAKSAGIIIALREITGGLKPKKCFFAGMPLNWARANNIDIEHLFENYSVPTIFLQKKRILNQAQKN